MKKKETVNQKIHLGAYSVFLFVIFYLCFCVRYFIQYTSVSKQLSRDARLVSKALQEVDSLAARGETAEAEHLQIFILSDNITAGADYALGSQAQGLSGLTKAERLKLIFQALDKKDRIIKRMSSASKNLTFL